MEAEYLQIKLLECLDKALNSNYMVVPIIIDSAITNYKLLKNVLKLQMT